MLHGLPLRRAGRFLPVLAAVALGAGVGKQDATVSFDVKDGPARFVVRDALLAPHLGSFSTTVVDFGNEFGSSGFEPIIFRDRYVATEDSPNRVVAEPQAISQWNSLREGALDGAAVEIYRIENGVFQRVREDRVAEGGFHASGWLRDTPRGRLVPPDQPRATHVFDHWNRPGAEIWFAVQAVSASGALSAPSEAARIVSPVEPDKVKSENPLIPAPRAAVRETVEDERAGPDGAPPPSAPTGLQARIGADGAARLSWKPATDPEVAGYVVLVSDYPPERQTGFFLELAGGEERPPVRAGDLVILSKHFETPLRTEILSNRVWDAGQTAGLFRDRALRFWPEEDPKRRWRLVQHGPESPVAQGGETYLELTVAPGAKARVGFVNHGGGDQDYYPVLEPKPYRFSAWLRGDRDGVARFSIAGPCRRCIEPIEVLIGTEWRRVKGEFTPPSDLPEGGAAGRMELVFKGPGVYDVDNFQIWRADAPFLAALPETAAHLEASGMGALRTHGLVKTELRTYDLAQLTNPPGVTSANKWGETLPQLLAIMERAGVDPWLQIEPHLTPEEWLGLVEFLAAPFNPETDNPAARPWAVKRVSQGRGAPWTEAFDRIYFELGNETWNRMFAPWTFPSLPDAATGRTYKSGEVYGLFMEHVIATLRSSPWWRAAKLDDKVVFVLGGWRRQNYGAQAAAMSPNSDILTVASYNGGWDEKKGPPDRTPASFFRVLNNVSQGIIPSAAEHVAEAQALSAERGRPLKVGSYEGGPGYAMNGLNGRKISGVEIAAQEAVMKSRAAGVATLDSFLAQAALGFDLQNFFTFGEGRFWSSHARWNQGGAAYPSWMLLSLFNRVGTGDMLRIDTVETPRADLPSSGRSQPAVEGAPLIAAYATREGDRLTLVVISRRVPDYPAGDGFTPVTIDLPFARAKRLTLHRLIGAYDANNVEGPEVGLESVSLAPPADPHAFRLDAAAGLDNRGLPPAQALIYVFEGVKDS